MVHLDLSSSHECNERAYDSKPSYVARSSPGVWTAFPKARQVTPSAGWLNSLSLVRATSKIMPTLPSTRKAPSTAPTLSLYPKPCRVSVVPCSTWPNHTNCNRSSEALYRGGCCRNGRGPRSRAWAWTRLGTQEQRQLIKLCHYQFNLPA